MQRFNDLIGGTSALIRRLFSRLLDHKQPVIILDLGAGGAGIPVAIARRARWLRRASSFPRLTILAVDRSARSLRVAERNQAGFPEIELLRADALSLPFSPGGVDYVISSLFMHHFPPLQLRELLRQSYELARCVIVMSDLVRGPAPYLAFRLAWPILARNPLTQHDGALSIRRAYTPDELLHLGFEAGLPIPRVIRSWRWQVEFYNHR